MINKVYNLLNLLESHCHDVNMGMYDDTNEHITLAITNALSHCFTEDNYINVIIEKIHAYYKTANQYSEDLLTDLSKYCHNVFDYNGKITVSSNSISFTRDDFNANNKYYIHNEIIVGNELSLIKMLEDKFINKIGELNDIECIMFIPVHMYKKMVVYSKNKEYTFNEIFNLS